ncbi:MAG TPA: hypothetical protein VFI22_04535 [Thermomicrobiales bacterium]|nr:hypothetical protein [Thermomicrobiales bacterium]
MARVVAAGAAGELVRRLVRIGGVAVAFLAGRGVAEAPFGIAARRERAERHQRRFAFVQRLVRQQRFGEALRLARSDALQRMRAEFVEHRPLDGGALDLECGGDLVG